MRPYIKLGWVRKAAGGGGLNLISFHAIMSSITDIKARLNIESTFKRSRKVYSLRKGMHSASSSSVNPIIPMAIPFSIMEILSPTS